MVRHGNEPPGPVPVHAEKSVTREGNDLLNNECTKGDKEEEGRASHRCQRTGGPERRDFK